MPSSRRRSAAWKGFPAWKPPPPLSCCQSNAAWICLSISSVSLRLKGSTTVMSNGAPSRRIISRHSRFRFCAAAGSVETDVGNSTRVVVIKTTWRSSTGRRRSRRPGHRHWEGIGAAVREAPRQIIGVVGNVREAGLKRGEVGVMYVPQAEVVQGLTALAASVLPLSWAIRTGATPTSSAPRPNGRSTPRTG